MRRFFKIIGLTGLMILGVLLIYISYTAFFPTDEFYFSEFKKVTSREIPKSANVIKKDASYPDLHGDYCSASVMTISEEDYDELLNQITKDRQLKEIRQDSIVNSEQLISVMSNFKNEQIAKCFIRDNLNNDDEYLFICFLNDKKTIVVNVCST